jgi:hypothetical protein
LKDQFFFNGLEKPFANFAGPGDGKKRAAAEPERYASNRGDAR